MDHHIFLECSYLFILIYNINIKLKWGKIFNYKRRKKISKYNNKNNNYNHKIFIFHNY